MGDIIAGSVPAKGQLQVVKSTKTNSPLGPDAAHHDLMMQGNSLSSGETVAQRIGPPHGPNPQGHQVDKLTSELKITSPAQISFKPQDTSELHKLQDLLLAIYEDRELVYHSRSRADSSKFDQSTEAAFALDAEGVEAANDHFKSDNLIVLYTRFAEGEKHRLAFTVRKLLHE